MEKSLLIRTLFQQLVDEHPFSTAQDQGIHLFAGQFLLDRDQVGSDIFTQGLLEMETGLFVPGKIFLQTDQPDMEILLILDLSVHHVRKSHGPRGNIDHEPAGSGHLAEFVDMHGVHERCQLCEDFPGHVDDIDAETGLYEDLIQEIGPVLRFPHGGRRLQDIGPDAVVFHQPMEPLQDPDDLLDGFTRDPPGLEGFLPEPDRMADGIQYLDALQSRILYQLHRHFFGTKMDDGRRMIFFLYHTILRFFFLPTPVRRSPIMIYWKKYRD